MADISSTVGVGKDYATLNLYNAGDGGLDPGVGFTAIAECSGYLGSGANINGAFIRGAIIRGDVTWDGTNDSSLSNAEQLTIAAGTGINVEDLRIFTNNQFVSALNYNADFILMDRVVLDNTTAGLNAIDINGGFTNGHIRNFVARGGADSVMAGFNQGTNLTNGLVYGATDKGIEGSSSTPMVLTNILLFNNAGEDIDSTGGFTVIDCATEDLTGTYTGYTSAELVNLATGNLQTKSTSDLSTLGDPFIGALLEASAAELIITAMTPNYDFTVPSADVVLSGELVITAMTPNYDFTVPSADVVLSGELVITATTPNYDFTVPSADVVLSGGELVITASTPNYNIGAVKASVTLSGGQVLHVTGDIVFGSLQFSGIIH